MSESTQAAVAQIEAALKSAGLLDFSGEVQLLEWCKSSSRDGPKVKLLLPDDEAIGPFESATIKKGKQAGQLYHVFAIRIDEAASSTPAAPPKPERAVNDLAKHIHRMGYFNNPKLWSALHQSGIYTQSEHKVWVEIQPCWAGAHQVDDRPCAGDVCAHHCSSAATPAAGGDTNNPRKPPHWYCLPMCHQHHTVYCHSSVGADREGKARMQEAAVGMTAEQVKQVIKNFLGIESFSEITLDLLHEFERAVGLPLTRWPA